MSRNRKLISENLREEIAKELHGFLILSFSSPVK